MIGGRDEKPSGELPLVYLYIYLLSLFFFLSFYLSLDILMAGCRELREMIPGLKGSTSTLQSVEDIVMKGLVVQTLKSNKY